MNREQWIHHIRSTSTFAELAIATIQVLYADLSEGDRQIIAKDAAMHFEELALRYNN